MKNYQLPGEFPETEFEYEFKRLNEEKYLREIRRTSRIGQFVILLITVFAALGLLAKPEATKWIWPFQNKNKKVLETSGINDFKTKLNKNSAYFEWICDKDSSTRLLQLQKSQYGSNFKTVANVVLQPSEKKVKVTYQDLHLAKGAYYYRVMQTKGDEITFSPLLRVVGISENEDDTGEMLTNAVVLPIEESTNQK